MVDIQEKIGEQKIDVIISKDKNRLIEREALKKGVRLDINRVKIEKALQECQKHLERLQYAKQQLKDTFPLTQE